MVPWKVKVGMLWDDLDSWRSGRGREEVVCLGGRNHIREV